MSYFDINQLLGLNVFSGSLSQKDQTTFDALLAAKVESQKWCLGIDTELEYHVDINGILQRMPTNLDSIVNTDTQVDSSEQSINPLPMQGDATWLQIAFKEVGVEEVPGKGSSNSNPRIGEYLKTVGHPSADNIAWCSAFTNWCMLQVRVKPSGSAMARSWLKWGVSIPFKRGAIVVLKTSPPPYGHVGFALEESANSITVLGGNQSNRVMIKKYKKSLLLDYRWPNDR